MQARALARRIRRAVAAGALALLAGTTCRDKSPAGGNPAAADLPIAIIGATVLPMTAPSGGDTSRVTRLRDYTVLIRSRHIVAIGPRGSVPLPADVVVVDGRGRFLIPGLVDAHVHLSGTDAAADLPRYLANGVTTVRNMEGAAYHLRWRAEIASGTRLGPNLYTTGAFSDNVRSVAGADAFVRATRDSGFDAVKFHLPLPDTVYEAIIAAARTDGIPVTGHTPGPPFGVGAAVRAHQQTIEHVESIMQNDMDPGVSDSGRIARIVDALRGSNVCVTPTLVRFDHVIRRTREPAALANFRRQFAWMRDLVAGLAAAHVPLVTGTDTPFADTTPGVALHEELRLLVASGLSPYAALRAATADAARCLGHDRQFGVVRAGARADLLLLAKDPLLDIETTTHPLGLVVRGRWLPADTLSRIAH